MYNWKARTKIWEPYQIAHLDWWSTWKCCNTDINELLYMLTSEMFFIETSDTSIQASLLITKLLGILAWCFAVFNSGIQKHIDFIVAGQNIMSLSTFFMTCVIVVPGVYRVILYPKRKLGTSGVFISVVWRTLYCKGFTGFNYIISYVTSNQGIY